MVISLEYNTTYYYMNHNRSILWDTDLIYDFKTRGCIEFFIEHRIKLTKQEIIKASEFNYEDGFDIFNIINFTLSVVELVVVLLRVYEFFQIITTIKENLIENVL